jgi:hypothetical protein
VRVPVAVVEELEVVDVEDGEGERQALALRERDALGEVVVEGALVGQVGQPVARGAAQREPVAAHQRAPADEVEDGAADDDRQQPEHDQRAAQEVQARVEARVAVGDLERVAAVGQVDRRDELEVATVGGGIGLVPGVALAAVEGGVDARIGVARADGRRVAARGAHDAAAVDQDRLGRARPAAHDRDHVGHLAQRLARVGGGAAGGLEARDVGLLVAREVVDLAVLELLGHREVADGADDRERGGDGEDQPQREGARGQQGTEAGGHPPFIGRWARALTRIQPRPCGAFRSQSSGPRGMMCLGLSSSCVV